MSKMIHVLGKRFNGHLGRFMAELDHKTFTEQVAKEGLPSGWVAWHSDHNGRFGEARRKEIATLPVVYWPGNRPADPLVALELDRAKPNE
jgi:hypothetical protein